MASPGISSSAANPGSGAIARHCRRSIMELKTAHHCLVPAPGDCQVGSDLQARLDLDARHACNCHLSVTLNLCDSPRACHGSATARARRTSIRSDLNGVERRPVADGHGSPRSDSNALSG
jgi:hypothetical protein